jgi:hypothetical protein
MRGLDLRSHAVAVWLIYSRLPEQHLSVHWHAENLKDEMILHSPVFGREKGFPIVRPLITYILGHFYTYTPMAAASDWSLKYSFIFRLPFSGGIATQLTSHYAPRKNTRLSMPVI